MKKRVLITGFLIATLSLTACSNGSENKNTSSTGKNQTQTQLKENDIPFEKLGLILNAPKGFNEKQNIEMLVLEDESVLFSFISTEDNKFFTEKFKNVKENEEENLMDSYMEKCKNLGAIVKVKPDKIKEVLNYENYSSYDKKEKIGDLNGYEYYLLYSDKYDESNLSDAAKSELKEAVNSIKELKNNITIFDSVKNPLEEIEQKSEKINMNGVIDFKSKTLAGKDISSDIFKDYKLTMINIWSTSCGPCIDEMPDLQKLHEEAKKENVNVIGVVSDTPNEDNELLAKEITKKQGAKFDNIIPDEKLSKWILENIDAAPTTIFVDKDGNIVSDALVGSQNKDAYMNNIKEVLQSMDK